MYDISPLHSVRQVECLNEYYKEILEICELKYSYLLIKTFLWRKSTASTFLAEFPNQKKHTNFSLHQKQANFFLQRAYKANFILQRACGVNFLCNAYVAKQLTGIAKLYGMMKLFNISVTKQHRNNGNLIANPLEKR